MAFNIDGKQKQHLNLSDLAYSVIKIDMLTFEESHLSGFINTIFCNFRYDADASIALSLDKYRADIEESFSDITADPKTKAELLASLLKQKKQDLTKIATEYPKGAQLKFWLNLSNCEYLSQECEEDAHYATCGKYIKAVIEEYARLPYVDREAVFFCDRFRSIKSAISEGNRLRIQTSKGTVYSVYPYKILSDPLCTMNYLVGYSLFYDQPEDSKRPCSFRISMLKSVKVEKSKRGRITNHDKELLEEKIRKRGVQFLIGEDTEIKVRLTGQGVSKYNSFLHLRPMYIHRDDDIFTFHCTESQAQYYFFKFGSDAEILSPESLIREFKALAENTTDVYKENRE